MPYCRKCGKKIETNDEYCEECRNRDLIYGEEEKTEQLAAPAVTEEQQKQPETPAKPGRMDGFGLALTSAILGSVALGILGVILEAVLLGIENGTIYGTGAAIVIPMIFVGGILGIPPTVISIVFGIKSIIAFANNKKNGRALPIATLILGIYGLINSGLCAVIIVVMGALAGVI